MVHQLVEYIVILTDRLASSTAARAALKLALAGSLCEVAMGLAVVAAIAGVGTDVFGSCTVIRAGRQSGGGCPEWSPSVWLTMYFGPVSGAGRFTVQISTPIAATRPAPMAAVTSLSNVERYSEST